MHEKIVAVKFATNSKSSLGRSDLNVIIIDQLEARIHIIVIFH